MVSLKEIQSKIISVQSTKKIVKAMEMVAFAKMRKLQNRIITSRFYIDAIQEIMRRLAMSDSGYHHHYLQERNIKRIGYFVISTDRGLCGNLNIKMFKTLLENIKLKLNQGIKSDLAIIGSKGVSFFKSINCNIIAQVINIKDNPILSDDRLLNLIEIMLQAYDSGYLSKLYIVNNKLIHALTPVPIITQLLPLTVIKNPALKCKFYNFLYEQDPNTMMDLLFRRYIISQIHQDILENLASEHVARMIAMQSAASNCSNLIKELQLAYNKTRQNNITKELVEIISGSIFVH